MGKWNTKTERASSESVSCALLRTRNFILKAVRVCEGTLKSFKEGLLDRSLHPRKLGPVGEGPAENDSPRQRGREDGDQAVIQSEAVRVGACSPPVYNLKAGWSWTGERGEGLWGM